MYTDAIETLVPRTVQPVSLAALKSHLQLNRPDDDADLGLYQSAAVERFEAETGRSVIATTFRQWFDGTRCPVRFARGRASSVVQVRNGTAVLTGWSVDVVGTVGRLFAPPAGWPDVDVHGPRVLSVDFVAGWANAAAVPPDVVLALKLLAAHYWASRNAFSDSTMQETPDGFRRICDRYRIDMGIG